MADGDVCVAQVEQDWVVMVEGPREVALTYGSLRDAVEAGRRAALLTKSQLRLNLGSSRGSSSSVSQSNADQLSTAA